MIKIMISLCLMCYTLGVRGRGMGARSDIDFATQDLKVRKVNIVRNIAQVTDCIYLCGAFFQLTILS